MKIRRSLCGIAAASAGLLTVAGAAQAAPPKPQTFAFDLPSQETDGANGFCEDFIAHVEGVSFQKLRGGGKVTGRGTATVTNTETGEAITFNISGPGTTTTAPDGSFTVDAAGPNLFFTTAGNSFPGVPPLVYTTGHVRFTVDASGKTTSFRLNGRSTNVCVALS